MPGGKRSLEPPLPAGIGQCYATELVAHIRQTLYLDVSKGHGSDSCAFHKNSPLIDEQVRIFSAHCSVYGNENRMC